MSTQISSAKELDFTPVGPVFPSPRDWRDHPIYQVLIDRFDDGRDEALSAPRSDRRTGNSLSALDPSIGYRFQGGTIRGITRRLDYIRGLGCSAIWISPPFKNRQELDDTCHGYGVQDFLAIDPRFGTLQDLQELVREAHARQMYVLLDIIINHTGNNWGYLNDEPLPYNENGRYDFGFWRRRNGQVGAFGPDDAVWPIELQDPQAYKRRGRIRDFKSATLEEAVSGDFESLKDLDLNNPTVIDTMIRVYKWWIAQIDCDGFRIDTVKHADPEPTAIFCNAIREYARSIGKDRFFLFGEVVDNDEMLRRYIARNTPLEETSERYPLLDACLDFPLYFSLEEVIKGQKSPQELRDRYEHFRRFYRDFSEAGKYFVTFIDNHDQMCRPFRRFMHGETDPNLATIAAGYLLTNLGIPCIYYGTEQGFDGGGDNDNYVRECMFARGAWGAFSTSGVSHFDTNNPIYRGIATIAKIRTEIPALRYGRQYFRDISGNGIDFGPPTSGKCTLAYARVLDTTSVVVAINLDTQPRSDFVAVDANLNPPGKLLVDQIGRRTFTVEQSPSGVAFVRVPLSPRTMVILKPEIGNGKANHQAAAARVSA